ncbi:MULTISPECIES: tyrosine-type recombinase/integrase [Pseudomonas syringae group]|uniref:Site-specific recombinase, resolvase family protein n=2 Tax=Pseudomonas syringae group TaxID=136849 RepID=A0A0P9SDQ8_PSESX|nr:MULTISPECIES: site-specific integrase [Pseudomonas syringae group]KPW96457.1 Site-specific recombinase, resolvase family protein [Pseudomonas syringae pv. castaneae]KWS92945.1 resolvase [Pseudomonas syringae pv. castaneae]RMS94969.1 Site-specific recombinase, resolvase protein [Pseudomonas savastanoi]
MANIRSLPSGNWNAQVRLKGKPPQSKTFSTQAEAQAWADKLEAVIKDHKHHTIFTLGMTYCDSHLKGKGSYTHAVQIVEQLAHAFPQSIHDITPKLVNDFKLKRLQTVKPATCRIQLAFLSRFFKYAKRGLLIDIPNPVCDITLPKPDKSSDKVISAGELRQLLNKLSPTMALIVELAYETAMRRSEILKLTVNCLHLEERIADVVDGKNGTRSVPLTLRAIDLLEEAQRLAIAERIPRGRLFSVAPHSVSQAIRRARTAANLDSNVRLHQLRHTRITNVAKRGFNNAQIMIVSGHRDTRSVARYSHLNAKDVLHLID